MCMQPSGIVSPLSLASHLRLRPSVIWMNAFRSSGSAYGALLFSQAAIPVMVAGPSSANVSLSTPACPWRKAETLRDMSSKIS